MSDAPLLAADGARLTVGDAAAGPPLSLSTTGPRLLLAGDTEALVAALTGLDVADGAGVEVTTGTLAVLGRSVADGAHREVLGMVPHRPSLVPRYTARDYLRWSARLAGVPGPKAAAEGALHRVGLSSLARRTIGGLNPAEQRGLAFAAALVGEPAALLVDRGFDGLDAAAQTWLASLLTDMARRMPLVLAEPRLQIEGPVGAALRMMTDVVVLRAGAVVTECAPHELLAGARAFTLSIRQGADALAARLAERDLTLEGGPTHFAIKLPPSLGPTDLLVAAHEVNAVVIAVTPLLG
jgi:ABC-2 type transport system ATP-binding protein